MVQSTKPKPLRVTDAVRDAIKRDLAFRRAHGIALPEAYWVHPYGLTPSDDEHRASGDLTPNEHGGVDK